MHDLSGLGGTPSRVQRSACCRVHWGKRPADADYVILTDPEGNRFCVIDPG